MTAATAMVEGRRADSARRRQRVVKVLNTAATAGTTPSSTATASCSLESAVAAFAQGPSAACCRALCHWRRIGLREAHTT